MRTLLLATFACVTAALGQDRPSENAAAARIAEGVEKVRAGKLLDAVEQFQRVLDTAGDDLVPAGRHQFTPARWVVHGHLARLPAEGVRLYRQRIDGQAAKRLDEAKATRSDAALNRLLAEMFVGRASEEAILELARRAFERGEFDAAEHFWRMLLPGDDSQLRYPDPKTPPAAVLARLVLVKLFQEDRAEAAAGLALLTEKYGTESGLLAGRTGKYVETLAGLTARPAETTLPRPPDEPDWPTFAGSAARTGSTRARLPYFWPDVPAWKMALPLLRGGRLDTPPPDPLHPRALAFHPVVVGGKAYVADGARLFSIDLTTGQSATVAAVKDGEDTAVPARHDVRHTLTAADGVLYARMGPAALKAGPGAVGGSFIVAVGNTANGDGRELLWRLNPPAAEGGTTHFEGTPVGRGDKLFAAYWRQAGAEAAAGVACFRIDDPRNPPDLVWQRPVGKAAAEPNGDIRYRHDLLALAGPNVVYTTHGGTVIALDAESGRPAWEYRYPRDDRPTLPRYRDLCPPLVDGGRVYAAPADADRLLCLDAFTGRLIWERESVEVVHLLGVAKGRLIATLGGQMKGIRGFNLRTGADAGDGGWTIHDDAGEATFGRGLVTDEAVVWPTRHGLHFLNPTDGTPLREPIRGTFGNLCFADGCLIVTTATEVWGYPTEAKKLGVRRTAVDGAPDDPAKNAALAQSLIDAGDFAGAEPVIAKAGDAADRLRWFLAERLMREGGREQALAIYKSLADGKSAFATAAAVRRAEQCEDKAQAREAWRAVYSKGGTVRDEQGVPWPATTYAESRFGQMLAMRGTGVSEDLMIGLDPPKPPPPIVFVRDAFHPIHDPTLRILGTTNDRIVSVGDRLRFDSNGEAHRLDWQPTDGAADENKVVWCGGPDRIVAYRSKNGRLDPEIELRRNGSPVTRLDRPGLAMASGHEPASKLTSFDFNSSMLSLRYGERILASLNLSEGVGSTLLVPTSSTAGFHPTFSGKGGYILAQLTNSRMLVRGPLDQPLREYPASRKPWPEPPTHLGGDRFLVPDDNALVLFDARTGKTLARHTLPNTNALAGELPRVRVHQDHVLVIARHNHGVELDRLQLADLKLAWQRPSLYVGRELSDVVFVGDRLVVAADGALTAYFWATGERVWDAPLPETPGSGWKLAVTSVGIVASPTEARPVGAPPDLAAELAAGPGLWDGLLRAARKSYHHSATRELQVLLLDPADGRLLQRLTFPASGPAAGVAATAKGVSVVTGAGSWGLLIR